jgi:Ca2+:H+ antiporter
LLAPSAWCGAVAYLVARQTRPAGPLWYHVLMLLMTLAHIVALSTYLAVIVDFGIEHLGAPAPLGGILVAILVLSPEGLTAFHAALEPSAARHVHLRLFVVYIALIFSP